MLHAADGDIGRVHDLYFDDRRWTVRYLVVDTRHWLPGRRVLLSPAAVRLPDWAHHEIVASLSREQIRRCPGIDSDPPVGRRKIALSRECYTLPYYWALGGFLWTPATRALHDVRPCQAPAAARSATAAWRSAPQEHALDPRLRRQGHQRRRRPRRGLSDRRRLLGSLRPRRQCASLAAGKTRSRPVGVDCLGELDRAHRSRRPSDRAHPGRAELRSVTADHGIRRDGAEGVLRTPDTPPTRPDDLLAPSTLPSGAAERSGALATAWTALERKSASVQVAPRRGGS